MLWFSSLLDLDLKNEWRRESLRLKLKYESLEWFLPPLSRSGRGVYIERVGKEPLGCVDSDRRNFRRSLDGFFEVDGTSVKTHGTSVILNFGLAQSV